MPEITELFCFAAMHPDGDEGVPAMQSDGVVLPLIGADISRIESLLPRAQELADESGLPMRIYRFRQREQIGEVHPRTGRPAPIGDEKRGAGVMPPVVSAHMFDHILSTFLAAHPDKKLTSTSAADLMAWSYGLQGTESLSDMRSYREILQLKEHYDLGECHPADFPLDESTAKFMSTSISKVLSWVLGTL